MTKADELKVVHAFAARLDAGDPRDDLRLTTRLVSTVDALAKRGTPARTAQRLLALWTLIGRVRDAVASAARAPDAAPDLVEELAWLDRKLAARDKRAEPPWDVLHAYGWHAWRLATSDGPSLLARWDDWIRERGDVPLRRVRDGGAADGHGRRLVPFAREALRVAALEAAEVLRFHRIFRRQDRRELRRLMNRGVALQQVQGLAIDPAQSLATLIAWAARLMLQAAQAVDHPFGEPRAGHDPRARFRTASLNGPDGAEWIAVIEDLLFREPDVRAVLDATATRRATAKYGARGGPNAAAALAVEIVTGVSASTIDGTVRARARQPRSGPRS